MLLVTLTVVIATAVGIAVDRRTDVAQRTSRGALRLMLYVLVPYVSFVNFAHLHLTAAGGAGLLIAYVAIAAAGVTAWLVGSRWLRLPGPSLGALICCVIVVNTGYLGLPMTVVLLGTKALPAAVAYDQIVSGPSLYIAGFAIGAIFGAGAPPGGIARVRSFLTHNPPLLAVIAGLLTPAAVVPQALVSVSHIVVAVLLPLGFYAVGVSLSAERREERAPLLQRPDRPAVAALALRFLIAPVVLLGVSLTVLRLPHAYLLQAAMPCGINSLIVAEAYRLDRRLIATAIIWSTAITIAIGLTVAAT